MANSRDIPWIAKHIEDYQSNPAAAHDWDSTELGGPGILPTLLLTTVGRKSGEPRPTPLIYGKHDDSVVIIASKGGAPAHPVWFLNLEANPDCEVQVSTRHFHGKARVVEGEERTKLWDMMAIIYSPYLDYQKKTERKIPVVVIDPA